MIDLIKKYQGYQFSLLILLGLLILSVWPNSQLAEFHDSQRLISSILNCIALTACLWIAKLSYRLLYGVCVLFLWGMFAIWLSPMRFWSAIEFSMLFSTFLLCIVLLPRVNNLQIQHLAYIFVIVQAFYLVHNLISYLVIMLNAKSMHPYDLVTGFSNIRFYAHLLIWTVPFVIAVVAVHPQLYFKKIIIFVSMLNFDFQFLTGARAFFLSMCITIPVVWLVGKNVPTLRFQYLKWLFISILGGVVLYLLMLFIIPKLCNVNIDTALDVSASRDMLSSSGRIHLWQEALRLTKENPWFGAGPMMTAMLVDLKASAHPHNFIFQLLAEWGIPFTAAIALLFLNGLLHWKKIIDANVIERVPLALPVAASLSAGIAASMVDGIIVMPVSLIYMTIVAGLFAGLWRTWTPTDERIHFPKWLIPIFLLPTIFVTIYSLSIWTERNVTSGERRPIHGSNYYIIQDSNPRFWVVGHIAENTTSSKK